jgi:hypothetical protein
MIRAMIPYGSSSSLIACSVSRLMVATGLEKSSVRAA